MSRAETEKQKLINDKCQTILSNLLREEDNKYCVDCDAKGPRWASWNLGVFLCIRCAGIHRNLGVHISKVKSVNLDSWTPEQVACLQQMGNSQARAVYEANLPESFRRPQTDSSLEAFIRAKYEQKKYIAKEWVPPPAPKPAFDIEEEKRKEREKKKSRSKFSSNIEIPSLPQQSPAVPRPHSTGPHSPIAKPAALEQSKSDHQNLQSANDLLNLGETNGSADSNIFDAFLSAPQPTAEKTQINSSESAISKNNTSEEADFFNQKVGGDVNQVNKMTKESILSLYGSSSCPMPATTPMPPVYGIPGAVFAGQHPYAHVGLSGYSHSVASAIPNAAINVCSVTQPMANLQISGQSWNMGVPAASVNPGNLLIGSNQPNQISQTQQSNMWPPATNAQTQQTSVIWPSATANTQNISNLWQ